jgi:hypothetical protein
MPIVNAKSWALAFLDVQETSVLLAFIDHTVVHQRLLVRRHFG